MNMWAALGPCRCFSFQLSCLVITLNSVYSNINLTDGEMALFTYFGHAQQLWSLASSLYIFTFLAHFSFLCLISFLPSHGSSNHILSFLFFLQVLLPFFLLLYNFIPFLVSPPDRCYFKSHFVWLYYLISVFSSLVYKNNFLRKVPGLPKDGISRKFYCRFLKKLSNTYSFLFKYDKNTRHFLWRSR